MEFCAKCKKKLTVFRRHTCRTCDNKFCEDCLVKKPEWTCKPCREKSLSRGNLEAPKIPSPSPEQTKSNPPEEAKNDIPERQDYQREIIPFSRVVRQWRLVSQRSRGTSDGPVHALHAALVLFKDLWHIGRFLPPQERERWEKLRENLQLGFIKETKEYGNTSVSMGAAVSVSPVSFVGFLNCGSGGIKYQMYCVKNGILFLQAEYKPREGANLSAFSVGGYTPKTSTSFDKLQETLRVELKSAPWNNAASPIPVHAFITGKIRQHWEDASENERELMEAKMRELFAPLDIKKLRESYFMSQDEEGRLELLGSQTMYANLEKAGSLDPGTTVIGSLGIGQGSCQLMVMHSGQAELIAHRAGMGNVNELEKLSQTVIGEYVKEGKFSRLLDVMEGKKSVLALKSGCCLLLEQEPQLKAQLLVESSSVSSISINIVRNGQNKSPIKWSGPSNVSVLCGEAGSLLDTRENLEFVYRDDGREWEGETELKEGELLHLAVLGEPFLGKIAGGDSAPQTSPDDGSTVLAPVAIAEESSVVVHTKPVEPVDTTLKPAPTTETKDSAAESQSNFRSSIVPLSTICDHWLMMSKAVEEKISEDKEGPAHALHATLVLLKNVYHLDQFIPDDLRSRWLSIRDNVRVGFIKDTKKYGNTSVSMGVAKDLNIDCICLLNCGTGGIKYQMYLRAEGILFLVSEYKPKGGASPNALAVGGFKPKLSATFEATAAQLAEELSSAELPWAGKMGCAVYAFVTGSIRQSWEEADQNGKQVLEKEMERLFEPHGIKKLPTGSYFMAQVEEGRLELLGARAMYGNLVEAGLLEGGTNVIGSLGIGRGSCQWMILGDNGESELIGHQAGMANLAELAKLGQTVIGEYSRNRAKLEKLFDTLAREQYPVLALKSGSAILLQDEAYAAKLQAPVISLHKTVLLSRSGQSGVVEYVADGPADRLCAEGGFKLKTTENLEVLFRADGSKVKESETLKEGENLVLASLSEPFVPIELAPVAIHTPTVDTEKKIEAQPSKDVPKDKDYGAEIIPLEWIPNKWWLATPLMKSNLHKEVEGPVHGLHATMTLLKKLWFLDQFLPPESKEKWRTVRGRVHIGLIKDTKNHGNTSVSMGAAKTLLTEQQASIGFLNCGTGGIKYQMYTMKNGIISLKAEFKPKNGCSPNALEIGQYKPKAPMSFEETKSLLEKELGDPNLPWANDQSIPVYAFVTGTVRQYWEENKEEAVALEATMTDLFCPRNIRRISESYFMTQDEEGRLELIGSQAMYANLGAAGLLDPRFGVCGSFGIGQGSCQWMIDAHGKPELIGHKAGMRNLPVLADVGETVISTYTQDAAKLNALIDTLSSVERPVIALKSGCTLLLENKEYADLKRRLVVPLPLLPGKEVRVARVKTTNEVKAEWKGNLALFCAEAAIALSKPQEDFEEVFRENGTPICSDEEPVAENEMLAVARLGEGFGRA